MFAANSSGETTTTTLAQDIGEVATTHRLTSSLRQRSLEESYALARELAPTLGITRVTNTTWLDVIGIPVFASVRPTAVNGSLCVNAGKGVRSMEAKVGAYMEAIEFAAAEFQPDRSELLASSPDEIGSQATQWRFVDLCPLLDSAVDPLGPLAAVLAADVITGATVLVPAELVYSPFRDATGQRIFGSSTNGLSSGNTLAEATLHGLAEVLERDVQAFTYVDDRSRLVDTQGAPEELQELTAKVSAAGLTSVLRHTPNEYDLPYFQGFILEPDDQEPIAISFGGGLHVSRDIAAVRGLAEAAQSRLSYIHGGRDDLIRRFDYFNNDSGVSEKSANATLRARVMRDQGAVAYNTIGSGNQSCDTVDSALAHLLDVLQQAGHQQILRVTLSPPSWPFHVVKIIVPGLESFSPDLPRVGPRLAQVTPALTSDSRSHLGA